jgi:hypothetical protein
MAQKINPKDLPFDVPEFDEDEFVRKELISFRTTAILFVYTLAVALVTIIVSGVTDGAIPFLLLVILAFALGAPLPFVYKAFRIDISHFKKKEWIGTVLLFFFFWLGFSLLFMNPPFTDSAGPAVHIVLSPAVQGTANPVDLAVQIRDNRDVDESTVQFCIHRLTGSEPPAFEALTEAERTACQTDFASQENHPGGFLHTFTSDTEGRYVVYVTATDSDDHRSVAQAAFEIRDPPFDQMSRPTDPSGYAFEEFTDRIIVATTPEQNVRAVQYRINGTWYDMEFDSRDGHWFTTAEFQGWHIGTQQVTIGAEGQPAYADALRLPGGRVGWPGGTFNMTVVAKLDDEINVGAKTPAGDYRVLDRNPRAVTPGLDLPVFALGLVGAVVAIRRGRKDV